jgi:hypothetical protein
MATNKEMLRALYDDYLKKLALVQPSGVNSGKKAVLQDLDNTEALEKSERRLRDYIDANFHTSPIYRDPEVRNTSDLAKSLLEEE